MGCPIHSLRVINVLARLVSTRGAPTFLRSDNGPEFVSRALLSWIVARGGGTHSSPGYLTPSEFVAREPNGLAAQPTPRGTQAASKGGRLKLSVIRRIGAAQVKPSLSSLKPK